ncbi:hypothetical protein ACC738_13480 [Rhizobium ruizarguesonis]
MIFTVPGCIKLDLSFERLNGVDATGLYKNRDNRCSAEMMTRFDLHVSFAAPALSGCIYKFYPAPPIKHVPEYPSDSGDCSKALRPDKAS